MTKAIARFPSSRRSSDDSTTQMPDTAASFSDVFFGYLDEVKNLPEKSCDSSVTNNYDDDEEENSCDFEGKKAFWESQEELLQATLCRTSSIESKVRQATKEALKELNFESMRCACRNLQVGGCRNCLQRELCNRLRNSGYNCVICKSKWKTSPDIPSGEHTYLEVVENSSTKKGEVRVVIELNFRAEFEMARASDEYNRLISRLPEVFIGKAERLKALIKILCSAAKKCMKEKKMHLGPWRKHKYMQAKWLGTVERTTPEPLPVGYSDRPRGPKASMLSFDLGENIPNFHFTAVEVV